MLCPQELLIPPQGPKDSQTGLCCPQGVVSQSQHAILCLWATEPHRCPQTVVSPRAAEQLAVSQPPKTVKLPCSPQGTVFPGPPCCAWGRAEPAPILQVACMQFINIVVHSVENMNFRVFLQYEFTHLGLDQYLEVGGAALPQDPP